MYRLVLLFWLCVISTCMRYNYITVMNVTLNTAELAKKTDNVGDCCMMSICEWGHARLEFGEHIEYFDSQEHMDNVGEFQMLTETYLSCDQKFSWLHHLTMTHTSHFLFISSLLTWDGRRNMPMYFQQRRFNRRKGGNIFRSRTSARVLVMVLYWTRHGTTGMAG